MKSINIKNIPREEYWEWKEAKSKLKAEDWREFINKLLEKAEVSVSDS